MTDKQNRVLTASKLFRMIACGTAMTCATISTEAVVAGGLIPVADEKPAKETATTQEEKPKFTEAGHTTDSLETVKSRLEAKEAVLLDVRETSEWNEGHLEVAKSVPLSKVKDGKIPEELESLFPKDKPIYLHCGAGVRVLRCAEALKGKGYDIRPLRPGYESLVKFGFKTAEASADTPKDEPKKKD